MGYRGQMTQTQKVPLCVAAGHGSSTFLLPCVAFPQRAETSNVFTGTKNLARCLLVAPGKGAGEVSSSRHDTGHLSGMAVL